MSSYFPITGFKATVCTSTGDNRHNCARTTLGIFTSYVLWPYQMGRVTLGSLDTVIHFHYGPPSNCVIVKAV